MKRTKENSQALDLRAAGNAHLLHLADILDDVKEDCYLQHAWTDCAGAYCAASWWAVYHPERSMFLRQGPVLREESCPWFSIAKEFDLNVREVDEVFGLYDCRGTPNPKTAAKFIREFVNNRGEIPRWLLFPGAWPGPRPGCGDRKNCTHCHG